MTRDQILTDAFERVTAALIAKDYPAARAVHAELLDQPPPDDPAELHRQRLAEIGDDTLALAWYYGRHALPDVDIVALLRRKLNDVEQAEYKRGAAERRFELRAIELAALSRGRAFKPAEWMQR